MGLLIGRSKILDLSKLCCFGLCLEVFKRGDSENMRGATTTVSLVFLRVQASRRLVPYDHGNQLEEGQLRTSEGYIIRRARMDRASTKHFRSAPFEEKLASYILVAYYSKSVQYARYNMRTRHPTVGVQQ